jgi:hypothetical protein
MGDDDIRLPAPFAFKGERPYINAATMMEHLLPALRREFPGADAPTSQLVINSLKFMAELTGHGVFRIAPGAAELPDDAVMSMAVTLDGTPLTITLHAAEGEPAREPGGREKAMIEGLAIADGLCGSATICGVASAEDLFMAVVEANKQIVEKHSLRNGDKPDIRFGYLLNYAMALNADLAGAEIPVSVRNLGVREAGGRQHVLNRVSFSAAGVDASATICFNTYFRSAT